MYYAVFGTIAFDKNQNNAVRRDTFSAFTERGNMKN